jgi:signal transduction histidine kinase
VAVADEIELEDKYASLIAAFGAAALFAVAMVAAGGWILARKSAAPVERAIDDMRRFMADAAHELRTPLTVLRTRAEVALQRPRESAQYEEALKAIERESDRLGHVVEDLLTLARADAGERPIERRRVFLDDLVVDAADSARVMAERRSIRLEIEDFREAPVDGDPSLLRQLVLILLDNAVKYTPPQGEVRVRVGPDGDHCVLVVTDTGIGIPSDQLGRVFDRFYRGDAARTRTPGDAGESEGAGLGLSIARWIADEHGATIRMQSTPGQGTRVTVQFPVSTQQALSSS